MDIAPGNILLIGSALLLISIFAGKTTDRFGVPTLIFFLVVGMLAGSEGPGGINFNDAHIAHLVGITALNFILFSGGLDTNWRDIKPVLWKGIALSTVGVLVTAASVGLFAFFVFGLPLPEGLLLGAIVSSTDAAAIFSVLRNSGVGLKGSLRALLELESGSNDPMAYFLTIVLTAYAGSPGMSLWPFVLVFLKGFIIGGLVGFAMGKLIPLVINTIRLRSEGLYPVLMLGLAIFTYAISDLLGGNGFLAIYLCACLLGNSQFIHKKSMLRFYDGQAWLMQIILFLTLGLLVFPSQLLPVAGTGLLVSAFLIFMARPAGVFISLSFFKIPVRSKLFIAWAGLRGAVPIVFALYPLIAGLPHAAYLFNLVFFISVTSVLLQGTTLSRIARWLRLEAPEPEEQGHLAEVTAEIVIAPGSNAEGKKIVMLALPGHIEIITIKRGEVYITPDGATRVLAGDKLLVKAGDAATLEKLVPGIF